MVDSSAVRGALAGTIAADGMAISNVKIRAGALLPPPTLLAAVGCISLLKRRK